MPVYWNDEPQSSGSSKTEKRNLIREEIEQAEKYHPSARCPCEICQSQIADYTYEEAMDPDYVPDDDAGE